MPRKGSPQITRNSTGPEGSRLIEDAKVRHGDGHDVGLGHYDILRVNRPYAGIREVEGALSLALINPLEVAHNVRITRARRSNGEHSDQSGRVTRQNVHNDVKRTDGRRRRRTVVAVV